LDPVRNRLDRNTVEKYEPVKWRLKFIFSVAEPHHFYAAPAGAPTLLYSKDKFLKRTKVYTHVETILFK
jgi:hypothetical protein